MRQGLAALQGQSASGKMAMGGLSDQVAKDVALAALPGTIPELQAKLLQHARAQGVSGSGVHLVLGRVLKDQRIVKVDDRYTLVAETRGRFSEALTTVLDDMSPPPNITVAAEKVPMRR